MAVKEADVEVRTVAGGLVQTSMHKFKTGFALSASAVPLRDDTIGQMQTVLVVLMAAVGVILLIATQYIANLMLTRAAIRSREMASARARRQAHEASSAGAR